MFDKSDREFNSNYSGPTGFTGETDRINGEYHYKNGYTQKMYSDAHYVPADETTEPPQYYRPPEKNSKVQGDAQERHGNNWPVIGILVLLCLIIGCSIGAGFTYFRLSEKVSLLEEGITELKADIALSAERETEEEKTEPTSDTQLPASVIYENACQQVVGITTEVTYSNFFGMRSSSAVTGTGFYLTDNGYIITNYHVIDYAYKGRHEVTVINHEGERFAATIAGVEEDNDVAVLKIDIPVSVPVTFADSDSMFVGDTVYAVGNPLGELEFTMTTGHISALNREISTDDTTNPINMFQIDAAVNTGNSGGPVYDSYGRVIGVVTAKYSSSGVEGIGFAMPANDVLSIAGDLITKGYVSGKAYLGVSFDGRYNAVFSQYYGLPIGAYVYSVEPGTAANNAGIQSGDIIVAIDDYEIKSGSDVMTVIKKYSAGDNALIKVYRAEEIIVVPIIFDEAKPSSVRSTYTKTVTGGGALFY